MKQYLKVLKFGGSSVGSEQGIKNIYQIVDSELKKGSRIVLVCSALHGVTNRLLEVADKAEKQQDYLPTLKEIEQFHYNLIHQILPLSSQNGILITIKNYFNELEEILHSVQVLGEISWSVKDHFVAYGERLSCAIIADFLTYKGIKSTCTDARELIVTDSKFGNANVKELPTKQNIEAWYKNIATQDVPVVTGFIARNEEGKTTTLGRGGSDYTVAILGNALHSDEIEIWTDVDGFLSADPRIVKEAYSLEELTYQEAMEMCYFGAKVVYPPTLIPAVAAEIPVWVKNTFNPTHIGTRIYKEKRKDSGRPIKGISSINDVCLVNIEGSGMVGMKGFSARLFSALGRAEVNVILITQASSEHSISLVVSPQDAQKTEDTICQEFDIEIRNQKIERPQLEYQLSIIAVVGEKLKNTPGMSGKMFSALGKSGVNIRAIAQGSSERNISAVISRSHLEKALNMLHDAFFLSPVKTFHVFCAGTGNIGSELLLQLENSKQYLREQYRIQINVMGITNSRKMLIAQKEAIDLSSWKEQLAQGNTANMSEFVNQAIQLQLPNMVFVDNTSSKAVIEVYEKLFLNSISVVTCNKIGNSSSLKQYRLFKDLVKKMGISFYYETNVGAGLPVIQTLKDLCISGDKIMKIEAILSGTISYIFNQYEGDISFAEVVKQAQDLGYTEPDPRDDLNGMDFSRKMLILGREMGLPLEMESVEIDNFLPESCLNAPDVKTFYEELKKHEDDFSKFKTKAKQAGKKLRLIGTLENGKIRVSLQMVDAQHPFYNLSGSDNIISFTTMRYKTNPLVVKGPGAGTAVTAAGVFADLIKVTSY